ncbi:MAG: tryptophan 2,3-dioxygenase [Actinobacteria bacterium]|nr:tryptophan 2,3-dioxygenase [Actinomycetota bacterium]
MSLESRRPAFGEEDRKLSYGSYLRVDELLDQQRLLSVPPAHDELLFIQIHQVFELWFKQVIFELETIRDAMFAGDIHAARHYLQRVHAIQRVLIEQIEVLETMSPQDFLEFRTHISPASGFQSVQFREIEFLSGSKDPGYVERLDLQPEERARLEKRLSDHTLWDGFCALVESRGLGMPPEDDVARRASLLMVARDRDRFLDVFYLSESLLTYDELFSLWRQRHVLMVERMIGSKTGTGGSTGASYLRTTLDKRFYPDLWALRSYL